jgi:hypothetical protein
MDDAAFTTWRVGIELLNSAQRSLAFQDLALAETPILQTAIGKVAQAQIEADAVYNAQANLKNEAECWRELEMVIDTHRQMNQRLADSNLVDASPIWTPPDPSLYVLRPPPPAYVPPAGPGWTILTASTT